MTDHPHAGQPILTSGPSAEEARLAIILLHGRGASAEDILGLAREFALKDVLYLAPQAFHQTWYPYSFLTPMDRNEPFLGSALRLVGELVASLEERGVAAGRIGFAGFSQGGCLSLEFAARNARRYAGIAGLSGGLIGPPGTPRTYPGGFDGTPVFLGCSDVDAHIPLDRVHETAAVLGAMGAAVDERIYPRMGHAVNSDEVAAVRAMFSPGAAAS